MAKEIVMPGVYKHFTGKEYEVMGIAEHTETGEQLVIYIKQENRFDFQGKVSK